MAVNLEHEARASFNYLERLVDADTGFTFFDVLLTEPAAAVHDWPDFLDVPGRSAETCVLLRHMTGRAAATEDSFYDRILGFQREDGLFHRPETRITRDCMMLEEQALVMGALLARAIGDGDRICETALVRLIGGIAEHDPGAGPFPAMLLRPLARAFEHLGHASALELARRYRDRLAQEPRLFRDDGSFAGHVHSHLYAAAGLVELGRLTEDEALIEWMDRVFRVMRSRSTAFGFVPELTERQDDVIGCETCCLMDYIHLALALTRAGHPEYFDDVERAARNHLIESRVRHGDWLPVDPSATDDELILRSDVRERVIGAYAGWSSPNHILAYDEHLPAAWIKDPSLSAVYLGKVRALQNCCSPSGPKALYLAWQHAVRSEAGVLRINLLLDRALPEGEVRCLEPREGKVRVAVRAPLRIALRVPGAVTPGDVRAEISGTPVELRQEGGYLVTRAVAAGDLVEFDYPLPAREEAVVIGNEGHQQYEYLVGWRGSTVTSITPSDNPRWGHSHLMDQPVQLYYGAEGPHPIYRREGLLRAVPARPKLNATVGPSIW